MIAMCNSAMQRAAVAALLLFMSSLPISAADAKTSVTFFVADSCERSVIDGVSVTVVTKDGKRRLLGTTRESGALVVDRTELDGAQLLLFCAEGFFCTSLSDADPEPDAEILVLLAPAAVM